MNDLIIILPMAVIFIGGYLAMKHVDKFIADNVREDDYLCKEGIRNRRVVRPLTQTKEYDADNLLTEISLPATSTDKNNVV